MRKIVYDLHWLEQKRIDWSRALMLRILAEQALEKALDDEHRSRLVYYEMHDQFVERYAEDSKPLRWIDPSGMLCVSTAKAARVAPNVRG